MANIKNPLAHMAADDGEGWDFAAVIAPDDGGGPRILRLFLQRKKNGAWWAFDEEMPMVTSRSEAPSRINTEDALLLRGPISSYPCWLPVPRYPAPPALYAADVVCRAVMRGCHTAVAVDLASPTTEAHHEAFSAYRRDAIGAYLLSVLRQLPATDTLHAEFDLRDLGPELCAELVAELNRVGLAYPQYLNDFLEQYLNDFLEAE